MIAIATVLAYRNAAPSVFIYDDRAFLPLPRLPGESLGPLIGRIFAGNVWPGQRLGVEAYRPLAFATMALDGALYGDRAVGYHITSIALHVAVTVALYFVLRALLRRTDPSPAGAHSFGAASVAALLFGLHPIHTEAVDSVFNRGEVLVTLCTLLAIALGWRLLPARPRTGWLCLALIYIVALLCKESAATLPGLLFFLFYLLRSEGTTGQRLGRVAPAVLLAVPLGLFLLCRHTVMARTTWGSEPILGVFEAARLSLTGFRDLLGMVLWPGRLRAVRTDYVATALPLALVVIAAYAALIAACWRRLPGVAAGLLFFALAILPSLPLSTRLGNAQVLAERYVYLPSLGLFIALGFALAPLERRFGAQALFGPAIVLAMVLLLKTQHRNRDWHSAVALFEAEVAAAPGNREAVQNLVTAYAMAGRSDDALALCRRHEDDAGPGLELSFLTCGRLLEGRRQFVLAERYFQKGAGGQAPPPAYYTYGRLLFRLGRSDEAAKQYERALAIEKDPVRQHTIRAELYFKLHPDQPIKALAEISAALAIDPSYSLAKDLRRRIEAREKTLPIGGAGP